MGLGGKRGLDGSSGSGLITMRRRQWYKVVRGGWGGNSGRRW